MKSTQEALDHLLSFASPVEEVEEIVVADAFHRVLAEDLVSKVNVPPMDNSQMDGYAIRCADVLSGKAYPISQRVPAGSMPEPLAPGSVARIFTGAPIPLGADAVVMQENTQVTDNLVHFIDTPKVGQYIRRTGEDIHQGQLALTKGTLLRPQELGVAASSGYAKLKTFRRIRVALFFTGDELTMPGDELRPGRIYNSNRDTLIGCLKMLGCEVTDLGIVPDQLTATQEALLGARQGHDLIITSGGVSVGEEDHVKPAVTAVGHLDMWQIAMKPGKPLAFGYVRGVTPNSKTWFMGLPGNPVSSFVTFLLFVRPFISKLQGRLSSTTPAIMMRADFDWHKPDRRNEFLRVRINSKGGLDLYPNQSSGVLMSASWADGLLDNPPGQVIHSGQMVKYIPFLGLI